MAAAAVLQPLAKRQETVREVNPAYLDIARALEVTDLADGSDFGNRQLTVGTRSPNTLCPGLQQATLPSSAGIPKDQISLDCISWCSFPSCSKLSES